jgi:two-component system sensor histidine kinase HydH
VEELLSRVLGQDVSKLAAREKQLLLSRLLARLAHEIRNPLSSLDIHVQLLAEDIAQTPPERRSQAGRRLELIRGELHRLDRVVAHFLSLAAPSALDLQPVRIRETIEHVCALLRPEAETRGIQLVESIPIALPILRADPVRLTQALVNLVINALQAVTAGGRVEVTAIGDAADDCLVVSVRDTGPGIPDGKHAAIFEPFFTTKAEGSGLGLWIVQQIVLAHGGRITVATAEEGGAIFELHLPLHPGPDIDG